MIFHKNASIRERQKNVEVSPLLGFSNDINREPNCDINRYAFEFFFHNSLNPNLMKFSLTSDHIEHGFQVLAQFSEKKQKIKQIINHLFLFAFTEILFADNSERANLFIERQSHYCTLKGEDLRQLVDLDPELTDSVSVLFDHLVAPLDLELDQKFFEDINELFLENDLAPAISFLLRHFLHNKDQMRENSKFDKICVKEFDVEDTYRMDSTPSYFVENESTIQHNHTPYAEFRIIQKNPVLYINQPKYIPHPLPSLSCVQIPYYAEYTALATESLSFAYSCGSQLFHISNNVFTPLDFHQSAISAIAISPCGQWVLSGDSSGNIKLQNNKGDLTYYEPANKLITCIGFDKRIPKQFYVGTLNGIILYYCTDCKKPYRMFVGHHGSIVQCAFHPNGEFIASTALDSAVRIWSISKGSCVRVFRAAGDIPTSIRISNSGKMCMTTSVRGQISIVDLGTTQVIKKIDEDEKRSTKSFDAISHIKFADFSPDDAIIVALDSNSNYITWQIKENQSEGPIVFKLDKIKAKSLEFLVNYEVRILAYTIP